MQKLLLLLCLFSISTLSAQTAWPSLKELNDAAKSNSDSTNVNGKDEVVTDEKLRENFSKIQNESESQDGVFPVYYQPKSGKLFIEISDDALNNTYILSSRIGETSNTQDYAAGQMNIRPFMIRFSTKGQMVYMHLVQSGKSVQADQPIATSFERNFSDPIIKSFKFEALNGDNPVIDVTTFFVQNEKIISPLKPENPLSKLMGGGNVLKGTFVKENSYINSVKAFEKNVEIKSVMSFTTDRDPYTVVAHRSIAVLPKDVMPMRLQDNRVGYFNNDHDLYTTDKDKLHSFIFINRWRLEPKPEEMEAYFSGALVEPQQPIVFYVDNAFPENWRGAIKAGIEDWNTAFEVAGFKNAIQAKDYPTDDENFDPDDISYSCFRYVTSPVANASGPSYIDPRSGEIIAADVIWYHNIISLLHNWRFAQTAAADPRVRKAEIDEEVMLESMRYVAAHEVGHTLGLMHNMAGSYAHPTDSLRSPSFTQKYGTTASIMDYARFNFVAQPGDYEKGVKLTPPRLGVYDLYAIDWGYRLIPGVDTPEEEKPVLNAWIEAKKGDAMYEFGAQQLMGTIDPTAQAEDLGNEHFISGDYAVANLKEIMANFTTWLQEDGANYEYLKEKYDVIFRQYLRHVRHVMPYIGGVNFKEIRQGDDYTIAKSYVNKQQQQQAMQWLVNQARTYKSWVLPLDLQQKLEKSPTEQDALMISIVGSLLSPAALQRIYEGEMADPENNYKLEEYVSEAISTIFEPTIKGKQLSADDLILQAAALAAMTSQSGLSTGSSSKKSITIDAEQSFNEFMNQCSDDHALCGCNSFFRINFGLPTLPSFVRGPIMTNQLREVLKQYKRRVGKSSGLTKNFYEYQIMAIERLLN